LGSAKGETAIFSFSPRPSRMTSTRNNHAEWLIYVMDPDCQTCTSMKNGLNRRRYFLVHMNKESDLKDRIFAIEAIGNRDNFAQINHIKGIRPDTRFENLRLFST
jgi:hypothetical protein